MECGIALPNSVHSPLVSSSGRSLNIRARRQPWFGVVVTLVVVAVVIAGSFALKAFGDSREEGSDSANRGAAGGESLNIVLKNSSSVTIAIGVINVKREEWNFPAPDSAAPKGLQGAWIDPGESLSVTLSLDNPTNPHSPFKVTTTPMAGSSIGGVITLFGQLTSPAVANSVVDHRASGRGRPVMFPRILPAPWFRSGRARPGATNSKVDDRVQ